MSRDRIKPRGVVGKTKRAVINQLLSNALMSAQESGSQVVVMACEGLTCLDEVQSAQILETIGLVDGHIELANRYNKLAREERERAVDPGPEEDEDGDPIECCTSSGAGEVPCNKARNFSACPVVYPLKQCRTFLSAAEVLLTAANTPVGPRELVPVPAATGGGSGDPRDRR